MEVRTDWLSRYGLLYNNIKIYLMNMIKKNFVYTIY